MTFVVGMKIHVTPLIPFFFIIMTRFIEALNHFEKARTLICRLPGVLTWPTSNVVIEETRPGKIKVTVSFCESFLPTAEACLLCWHRWQKARREHSGLRSPQVPREKYQHLLNVFYCQSHTGHIALPSVLTTVLQMRTMIYRHFMEGKIKCREVSNELKVKQPGNGGAELECSVLTAVCVLKV